MANLGKNEVWDDLRAKPANASRAVMGPEYSYAENIRGPSALGVGTQGTFSQVGRNTGAVIEYVKYMISGPALGNQYFINTGATCRPSDNSIQSRYNYINNISNGRNLIPQSMRNDLGGVASDFNGLLPGMLQDIGGLNPVNLFSALAADSTPSCDCYTCPTSGGRESQFLTPSLSPDFDPAICKKVDNSLCVKGKEGFTSKVSVVPVLLGVALLVILTSIN